MAETSVGLEQCREAGGWGPLLKGIGEGGGDPRARAEGHWQTGVKGDTALAIMARSSQASGDLLVLGLCAAQGCEAGVPGLLVEL